jgi:hypothetical protein
MNQRSLETYVMPGMKDELVPEIIHGFSPGAQYITQLLTQCPFVYTLPASQSSLPFNELTPYDSTEPSSWHLEQVSPNHNRSFEVIDEQLPPSWQDEFGHTYTSLNLKGNGFYNAILLRTSTAPDGVIAFGLQESSVIRRVLRASRILRSLGVSTEYILGLAEPSSYAMPLYDSNTDAHANYDLGDYKTELIKRHWESIPETNRTAERLVELQQAVARMTFYVTARAMDTSLRLEEINDNTKNKQRLFDIANDYFMPNDALPLDVTNVDDVERLLKEVTIPSLSKNLARMHVNGLAHKFPNGLNITALGSIVDLDSVHGETLGFDDTPITAADIFEDLLESSRGIIRADRSIYKILRTYGEVKRDDPVELFLKLYKQEYLQAVTDTAIPLSDIAAAGLNWESELFEVGSITPQSLASSVYEIFVDQSERINFDEGLEVEINKWFDANKSILQDDLDQIIEANSTELAELLIDEWINEIRSGTYPNPAEVLYKLGEKRWETSVMQYLLDLLQSPLEEVFANNHQIIDKTVRHTLISAMNSGNLFMRGVAAELLQDYFERKKDWLYDICELQPFKSIMGDNVKSDMLARGRGTQVIREVPNIPIESFIAHCKKLSDKLVYLELDYFRKPRGTSLYQDTPPTFGTTELGSTLNEIITDKFIDGVSFSYDLDPSIEVDVDSVTEDAEYMASVEKLVNGTYKIRLLLTTKQDYPSIAKTKIISATTPAEIDYLLDNIHVHSAKQLSFKL